MLIPLGFWAASGAGSTGSYELISTTLVSGTGVSQVDFASIAQTYKHLQLRMTIRDNTAAQQNPLKIGFNNDLTTIYDTHNLSGDGSTVISNNTLNNDTIQVGRASALNSTSNMFTPFVVDILDYTSANKNKVTRSLYGYAGSNNEVGLRSGSWRNTAAITSVKIYTGGLAIGSRLSLYGIKG